MNNYSIEHEELFNEVLKKILPIFTHAIGSLGMVGGQVADLESADSNTSTEETLKYIHLNYIINFYPLCLSEILL